MSERSRQARQLARYLAGRSGVEVSLEHLSGAKWDLQWADGPTYKAMAAELEQAVAARPYALMRDRDVRLWRGSSHRAWAATAVALIVDDGDLPTDRRYEIRNPADSYDIQLCVEGLIDETTHPQRARRDSHEPMIEQLLRYRYPHEMAEALANNPDRALSGDDAEIIAFPDRARRTD